MALHMRRFRSLRYTLVRLILVLLVVTVVLSTTRLRDLIVSKPAQVAPRPQSQHATSKKPTLSPAREKQLLRETAAFEGEITMETDEPKESDVDRYDLRNATDGIISASEEPTVLPEEEEPIDETRQILQKDVEITNLMIEQFSKRKVKRGHRNVYIFNSIVNNFERVIPFLTAFAHLTNTSVTLYAFADGYDRLGMRPWLDFYALPGLLHLFDMTKVGGLMEDDAIVPDVLLLTHCVQDLRASSAIIEHMLSRGTHVICTVREPAKWNLNNENEEESPYKKHIEFMKPWAERKQWTYITQTTSVKQYVSEHFPDYLRTPDTKYDTPIVYPLFKLADTAVTMEEQKPYVVIPGNVELWKDNQHILQQFIDLDPPVNLRLMGFNNTELEERAAKEAKKSKKVPRIATTQQAYNASEKVGYLANLDYPDYYQALSRAILTVPAKERGTGYKSRVSGTLMAGIVTATPPLVAPDMLLANTFLSSNNTWVRKNSETAIDAISRIARLDKKMWIEKKLQLAILRNRLIYENLVYFESVLSAIKDRNQKLNSDYV